MLNLSVITLQATQMPSLEMAQLWLAMLRQTWGHSSAATASTSKRHRHATTLSSLRTRKSRGK